MIIMEFFQELDNLPKNLDPNDAMGDTNKRLRKLCREFLGLPNELITWDSDGMGNFRRVDGGYWVEANSIKQAWEE